MLRFTASFILLSSTPYNSAKSRSIMTFWPLIVKIQLSMVSVKVLALQVYTVRRCVFALNFEKIFWKFCRGSFLYLFLSYKPISCFPVIGGFPAKRGGFPKGRGGIPGGATASNTVALPYLTRSTMVWVISIAFSGATLPNPIPVLFPFVG